VLTTPTLLSSSRWPPNSRSPGFLIRMAAPALAALPSRATADSLCFSLDAESAIAVCETVSGTLGETTSQPNHKITHLAVHVDDRELTLVRSKSTRCSSNPRFVRVIAVTANIGAMHSESQWLSPFVGLTANTADAVVRRNRTIMEVTDSSRKMSILPTSGA
jgi:hypothetical protein